ncbi:MAG: amidohydrolase family protein [Methanobacteriaceae archaeon]|nr:amidohydrolase family protein [Methanobacteriaceae archaeon]
MIKKILINGKIWTENPDMEWAEAIAIEEDKFVAVGSNEEVKNFVEAQEGEFEVVDLEGKTVLPGIIEGHTHPGAMAKGLWVVYGPLTDDKEELFANIERLSKKYPKEERPYFYYARYMSTTFADGGPHKDDLDAIISDRPARIQDDTAHACLYNSVALEMLKDENGIPRSISPIADPDFVKDENGEYTGWCHQSMTEGDVGIYESINWRPPAYITEETGETVFNTFRHFGITCMMDAGIEAEENLKYLYELDQKGELDFYYEGSSLLDRVEDLEESIARAKRYQKEYGTKHIRCNIVKFFLDGSNEFGDVLSTEPFHNDPEGKNCGTAHATMEEMRDVLVRLNEEKLDYHVHCVCDGSFRLMCDAVEEAQKICGDDWCIYVTLAHCEIIHPDDIPRIRELGIYIDYTPAWSGGTVVTAKAFLGEERWARMFDYTPFLGDDQVVGFSSDTIDPYGLTRVSPFLGMQIGMTRVEPIIPIDPSIYVDGIRPPASAKLSLKELIHGYTMVNAKRMRLDDIMGSIEVGKVANLVVLTDDIFECPPENVGEIDAEFSIFEGKELRVPNPVDNLDFF